MRDPSVGAAARMLAPTTACTDARVRLVGAGDTVRNATSAAGARDEVQRGSTVALRTIQVP
jgi:hypothetical protein